MDSMIAAAARALATGDVLGALKRVGVRDDPPALALRGIAMAQVGEYPRARELLRRAARTFGAHEDLADTHRICHPIRRRKRSMSSRDDVGAVFHTYSAYGRGVEVMMGTYNLLDLTPKGRDEDGLSYAMEWVRHHDRYGPAPAAGSCCSAHA